MKISCPTKTTITSLLFFLFFVLFSRPIEAMNSMSLTATPVRLGDDFSIKIAPGEKKQVQVKIRNGSPELVSLESVAMDFIVAADGATPVLLDSEAADARWSLASWLTLAPAQHSLASEAVGVVNVLIEVPEDALPGGRYAMIYHRPLSANEADFSGSGISQRVGTLLYVIVEGPINEEAYISNFTLPEFLENGPVDFMVTLDNQSDIHINTKPMVRIYNWFGQEVAALELSSQNIFPKSEREFYGTWNKIWGFGLYKAVVESAYGSQGGVATATASVFMLPVKLILLILIASLILFVIFLLIKKRKESSQAAKLGSDLETRHEESDTPQKEN